MKRTVDIGWAAGFLEGEGSFQTAGRACPGVSAVQVQREPLERLQRLFGGTLSAHRRVVQGRERIYHRWTLYAARGAGLMMTLFTLMSPKRRDQIRAALQRWREAPGRVSYNRSKTHCAHGHEYTPANTYRNPRGRRNCRLCIRACQRRYVAQKRAAGTAACTA